jgi:hypothetical protein
MSLICVKHYVERSKSDAVNAEVICEAVTADHGPSRSNPEQLFRLICIERAGRRIMVSCDQAFNGLHS